MRWLTHVEVPCRLLAATASGLSGTAFANSQPGDGFDVTSYHLELTPDIANKTIEGRETITLRATRDGLEQLSFSGNALSIDSATLDKHVVAHQVQNDVLTFSLGKALPRGRSVRLELSYHGRPVRGFAGSATSLFTSYFACDWMVCSLDQFGDKARFSLDLRVPAGTDTLSVGRMVAKRREPGGNEIHRWREARSYSAYLYGFAIGRFVRASEQVGPAKLTYLSDATDAANLKRHFGATGAIVRFFSEKAGISLPVTEYSQFLVARGEAQEAATYSVIGLDALPSKPDDAAGDWVIAHELAHQWWGNSITCATLKDFWLSEGIATFMTAAWKEHHYGRAAYDAELDTARKRLDRARSAGFDKPLAWDGRYPNLGTRRAVQYSKGALFMDNLRATLGDTVFWAGLKRYTRAHAGGPVTSIDLERAMEVASGRDLRPLFAEWVFGDGSTDGPPLR